MSGLIHTGGTFAEALVIAGYSVLILTIGLWIVSAIIMVLAWQIWRGNTISPKNRKESGKAAILSGIVDLPIVRSFILVGVLVSAFYRTSSAKLPMGIAAREAFLYFILTQMPAGLRRLVIAGIMATAMGSLSTALNAMATSFTRDFVLRKKELRGPVSERQRVRILRWSTVGFAILMVSICFRSSVLRTHDT